jgi:hypothetical protein
VCNLIDGGVKMKKTCISMGCFEIVWTAWSHNNSFISTTGHFWTTLCQRLQFSTAENALTQIYGHLLVLKSSWYMSEQQGIHHSSLRYFIFQFANKNFTKNELFLHYGLLLDDGQQTVNTSFHS